MFRFFILLSAICFCHSGWAQLNSEAIRVRLEKEKSEILLEGIGIQISGRKAAYTKIGLEKNNIENLQKIKISRDLVQAKSIWKVTRYLGENTEVSIVTDEILALKAIYLSSSRHEVPQQIFFWPRGSRQFDVIAVLPLEDYLKGVLQGEMPSAWPLQTLKAQAIAARSYALAVMQERKDQPFHVENNVMDQVFKMGRFQNKKINQAVSETENLVLVDKKNKIYKSFFHSDCGGKTASAKDVWGQGASTQAVVDSACAFNSRSQWVLKISEKEMSRALGQLTSEALSEIESIQSDGEENQERAFSLQVIFKNGLTKNILTEDFRKVLGFDRLKSSFFRMRKEDRTYVFSGIGHGHGVGLCQWGARSMGLSGKNFWEILGHYYPQASLYLRRIQLPETKQLEMRLGLLRQTQRL